MLLGNIKINFLEESVRVKTTAKIKIINGINMKNFKIIINTNKPFLKNKFSLKSSGIITYKYLCSNKITLNQF